MSAIDSGLEEAVRNLNYHHAAFTYLDECFRIDGRLIDCLRAALSDPDEQPQSKAKGIEVLAEFLSWYSVARNFKLGNEPLRYEAVWNAIRSAVRPAEDNVIAVVEQTCLELQKTYSATPWSATTKLLWLRFQSPVVMLDSLTWNWMRRHSGLRENGQYGGFLKEWRRAYGYAVSEIQAASLALLDVRRFTRQPNISDEELRRVIESPWFHERVFDHAMVNDESERE